MDLVFTGVTIRRGCAEIRVSGRFTSGIHLVSGRVGAGKSTFASMAAGILAPTEGKIDRVGINRTMLSFQFPEWHLTGNTIRDEIRSYDAREDEILDMAGIPRRGDDDPLSLSRGEMKRLVLACIFSKKWDLLVLDEPFGALDCGGKREVCRWIEQRRGAIVILCTHEQNILPRIDEIWEFDGHELAHRGPVPGALHKWNLAPRLLKEILSRGIIPDNLAERDIQEALCRTRG